MTIKAQARIIDYEVVKGSGEPEAPAESELEQMHEKLARPEQLAGRTYKVKTPLSEHALYVTINDLVLNADTPHETRRPFEMFINSKNMDHFQWIVALTRIVSAVFRKGGDCTFLVEELRSVFDPKGGYFKPGGRFMPSLVAEIGEIIERHLTGLGMMSAEPDPHLQAWLDAKREQLDPAGAPDQQASDSGFPAGAQLCDRCHTVARVVLDGCLTCLNCGDSKCG
jgi:hypothetical protein